ncbi:MAG: chromosome segregation ATPase [Haloarculaceae archaeon]|jgi:chromosome segregation ATPase
MGIIREQVEGVELQARNVGGIDETRIQFEPGVNVLSGRNATNRTSLLQAVMAAMGSDRVSLKGDSEEGDVRLDVGQETYTRSISRIDDSLSFSGDPYLDDPEAADLFAFLLESNEARRAVERGEDLREIIMRPVDTAAIKQEIEDLTERRREIDDKLEELSSLKDRLPTLEEQRTRLQSEIEDTTAEIEDLEATIEEMDADVNETREEKDQLEQKLNALQTKRNELESVETDIETQRKSLDALHEDREKVSEELADLPEATTGKRDHLEDQIERLRSRQNRLVSRINQFQSIIQFNEDVLEGDETGLFEELVDESDESDSVTDQLLPESNTITCWTCGNNVKEETVEENVRLLRSIHQDLLQERSSLKSEIDDLESQLRDLEAQDQRRDNAERNLERIEDEIADREGTIEDLEDRKTELETEIETLEAAVEDFQDQDYDEVLDHHKELNQRRFERDQLQEDLADVTEEIETIESRLGERAQLQERREAVQADLEDARTRIEQIERESVEAFNDHMDELLDILEYANIDRIWIERTTREVREGRRTVERSYFDLHVVRSSEDGVTYEDTVEHLSESEREVTGLVFALAGYLTHDVHETVPFMVLDSLEALDSGRIAALVEYVMDYPSYLIVALLPEDADALADEFHYVTDI